jgi:hypothetical protein
VGKVLLRPARLESTNPTRPGRPGPAPPESAQGAHDAASVKGPPKMITSSRPTFPSLL